MDQCLADVPTVVSDTIMDKLATMVKNIVKENFEEKLREVKTNTDKRLTDIEKSLAEIKNHQCTTMTQKVTERLDMLECKMDSMSDDGNMRYIPAQHQQLPQSDRSENVVIFNLMEGTRENLMNKTNVLFKR